MKLGTYSTIDCPTENVKDAYDWLASEFGEIGGTVRKVSNSHEFGSYQSFEIDYPSQLEFVEEDEEYEDQEDQRLAEEKLDWHTKANDISRRYSEKFGDYL